MKDGGAKQNCNKTSELRVGDARERREKQNNKAGKLGKISL